MLKVVNEPVEYPEADQDDTSREVLLPEHNRNENTDPCTPPPPKLVLSGTVPGHIRDLNWWLMQYFLDCVHIFHMYAEMGNDEHTEMQLKFQDSRNPSVFVTIPKVGGIGRNHTAANNAVLTKQLWVLSDQWLPFAGVVRRGENRVCQTWLLNTNPGGYVNYASDQNQHSEVAHMKVLHHLISELNITATMIFEILVPYKDHTMQLTESGDTLQSDEP